MFSYIKNVSLSLIVVTPLRLNVGIDKYADLPPNTTFRFYYKTTTCCGPQQNHHKAIK